MRIIMSYIEAEGLIACKTSHNITLHFLFPPPHVLSLYVLLFSSTSSSSLLIILMLTPLLPPWHKSFIPAFFFSCLLSQLSSFLTVLTSLQWDSVFIRCHPVASVLSELSVLHGVWADVLAVDARRDAAVQRWRRQRRLPGYQPGGQICRVQIWLWLWRSYDKVLKWCTCILFSVSFTFFIIFSNLYCVWRSVLQEWGADQSGHMAWAEGVSYSKEWHPSGGQPKANGRNCWGILFVLPKAAICHFWPQEGRNDPRIPGWEPLL